MVSEPKTIFDAEVQSDGSYLLTISSMKLAGADSVRFPVWSSKNLSNVIWYTASRNADGSWSARVFPESFGQDGLYLADCYAYRSSGSAWVGSTTFTIKGPELSVSVTDQDKDSGTFTIKASATSDLGIDSVKLPVWCSAPGVATQIVWYTMEKVASESTSTKAVYTKKINIANHNYQTGQYTIHFYATDKAGITCSIGMNAVVSEPKTIFDAEVQNGGLTYILSVSSPMLAGASQVKIPVWPDKFPQNIIWYDAVKSSSGVWEAYISIKDHKSAGGYTADCYGYFADSSKYIKTTSFVVPDALLPLIGYTIIGAPETTINQMVRYFESTKYSYPSVYTDKGAPTIKDFCTLLFEEAIDEGVRPEVVFVQAMLETGWLQFKGAVKPEQCNFAGIGAVDSAPTDANAFVDVRQGLRAQVQHLKAYADPNITVEGLKHECVDPRFSLVSPKGKAPLVGNLGKGNWASDPQYGDKLLNMINVLKSK